MIKRLGGPCGIHATYPQEYCTSLEEKGGALDPSWPRGFVWSSSSSTEFLALKQESRIIRHSSNPVFGASMMEQVRLCAVCPMENCLGSSLNQIQGWTTVRETYSRALEQGPLIARHDVLLTSTVYYIIRSLRG